MRSILHILFYGLFLLMRNGVENCHSFVYLVPSLPKCSHFNGVNVHAEVVLNLGRLPARCQWGDTTCGVLTEERILLFPQSRSCWSTTCVINNDKWQSWRTRGAFGRLPWNKAMKCSNGTWIGLSHSMCRNLWHIWCQTVELPSPRTSDLQNLPGSLEPVSKFKSARLSLMSRSTTVSGV